MRCKVGDLCILLKDLMIAKAGQSVTIVAAAGMQHWSKGAGTELLNTWVVDKPVTLTRGGLQSNMAPDHYLMPIRPDPDPESTIQDHEIRA